MFPLKQCLLPEHHTAQQHLRRHNRAWRPALYKGSGARQLSRVEITTLLLSPKCTARLNLTHVMSGLITIPHPQPQQGSMLQLSMAHKAPDQSHHRGPRGCHHSHDPEPLLPRRP